MINDNSTDLKNPIRVMQITSASTDRGLNEYQKCLCTVSMDGNGANIGYLVEIYRWAASRYNRCSLLLGDGSPYATTLKIRDGVDDALAARNSARAAALFLAEFRSRCGSAPEIIQVSELFRQQSFQNCLLDVEYLATTNERFSQSVRADAERYVARQIKRDRIAIPEDAAMKLSIAYLKEEIAVYLDLAKKGWLVDVYPGGELPTLSKIIKGKIPGSPEALQKRVNIAVESWRTNSARVLVNG